MEEKNVTLVAELDKESEPETHSMVIYGNSLYVIDGKKLLKMELPVETLWQKIGKFLGIY